MRVFPSGRTIKQNPIFVLDASDASQDVVFGLDKKHKVYLQSGGKKIPLRVVEICVGQYGLTQALLRPDTELQAGHDYTLCVDGLPQPNKLRRYNSKTNEYEPITYKVVAGRDTVKPQVFAKPRELKKTLVEYGCGPSIHVVFSNPARDESPIIIKTTVKNLKTRKKCTYYVVPGNDGVKVGHGMCFGAFDFGTSKSHEAEFAYMDASGNVAVMQGGAMRFTRPTKVTSSDEE